MKQTNLLTKLLLLCLCVVGSVNAWATSGTITAASTTDLGSGKTPRYVVEATGVGRLMKNKTGSSAWTASDGTLTTGSKMFALQTYNAISQIIINGSGTGDNRTFSKLEVGTATNNYDEVSATGSGKMDKDSGKITITPSSDIAANSYVAITLSGNINITSVELVYADARLAAPISWSAASYTAKIGGSNTFPTLSNENSLTVTYSSSDTDVASFADASTYAITLKKTGTTTISATYTTEGPSDTYKTTKVSYTLNVQLVAQSNHFWKFSDSGWRSNSDASESISVGTKINDNMELINGTASNLFRDVASYNTVDNITFTQELTFAKLSGTSNVLHFYVNEDSKITVYGRGNGSGSRTINIAVGSINDASKQLIEFTDATHPGKVSYVYTGSGVGEVFVYCLSNNCNIFGIKVEPLKCGTPTFSPASESSVEAGNNVTITSEDAATIYYKWTTSSSTPVDGWSSASATDGAIDVTAPDYDSNQTTYFLHAYGTKTGWTDSDKSYAQYTITEPDVTAPTLTAQSIADNATDVSIAGTITLTFSENVQVANASSVTLTGGAATISSVTAEDNVVTITYTGLAYSTTYTLEIADDAITDNATTPNAYAGTSFSFTTEAAPAYYTLNTFTGASACTITPSNSDLSFTSSNCQFGAQGHSGEIKFRWADGGTTRTVTITSAAKTIGAIVLTYSNEGTEPDITANMGSYSTSTKMWVGSASSVTFSNNSTEVGGNAYVSAIKVYYTDSEALPYETISTASGKTYATYVTTNDLDFTNVSDVIKAYVALDEANGTKLRITAKNAVPAGTALLVKTTSAGATVNVPVAATTPAAIGGTNKLLPGNGTAISYNAEAGDYYYILSNGEFRPANKSVVATGKAYLSLDNAAGARALSISFDDDEDETTAIEGIETKKHMENMKFYNLHGQQVEAPGKGLFIVNGKKVVVK